MNTSTPAIARLSLLVLAMSLSFPTTPEVHAGGIVIASRIGLKKVVERSPVIFRAKIDQTDHVTIGAGRSLHVTTYRVLVSIEEMIRGSHLKGLPGVGKQLWVTWKNTRKPNKWVRIKNHYRSKITFKDLKPGNTALIFLRSHQHTVPVKGVLSVALGWVAAPDKLKKVTAILRKRLDAKRERARANGRCKRISTLLYTNRCRLIRSVRDPFKCPKKSKAQSQWIRETEIEIVCRRADGTAHGPGLYWDSRGTLKEEITWQNGIRHGFRSRFGRSGHKIERQEFRQGKAEGVRILYHGNGKKKLEGTMVNGMRTGTWKQYGTAGKLLGQFNLKQGTGHFQSWRESGELYEKAEMKKGRLHGQRTTRHSNGKVQSKGQMHQGQPAGRWVHFTQDGKMSLVVCYSLSSKGGAYTIQWKSRLAEHMSKKHCPASKAKPIPRPPPVPSKKTSEKKTG
jgi:antitoxin component YwqK of YwqJK toxin-antitoxin module